MAAPKAWCFSEHTGSLPPGHVPEASSILGGPPYPFLCRPVSRLPPSGVCHFTPTSPGPCRPPAGRPLPALSAQELSLFSAEAPDAQTLPRPHPVLAPWPSAFVLLSLCLTCRHQGRLPSFPSRRPPLTPIPPTQVLAGAARCGGERAGQVGQHPTVSAWPGEQVGRAGRRACRPDSVLAPSPQVLCLPLWPRGTGALPAGQR